MVTETEDGRLREKLVRHAIAKTLLVSGNLVRANARVLVAVAASERLTKRAVDLIYNRMLNELVSPVTKRDMRVLIEDIKSLVNEC